MKRASLDLRGEVCPYTFVRAKLLLEDMSPGDEVDIVVDHRPAFANLPRALREDGHTVLSCDIHEPATPTDGAAPAASHALCHIRVRHTC